MRNNPVNTDQLKNYHIYPGQIGRGSFGLVKKGKDLRDNTEVALKYIGKRGRRQRQLRDIRNENDILKKICHEHIIKLLEVIETEHDIIIVTQYAETDLGKVLQHKKKFPYEDVKKISRQIFQALSYLHENNIIHRDLKPQNILIKSGMVKICDFGFAKKLSASTAFVNSMKGTPLYIAPEILNHENYNFKVDIWSFGIIIYELFDGKTPFHSTSLKQLEPKIKSSVVKYSASFPNELKELINEMLHKQPYTRATWQYLKNHSFFARNELVELETNTNIKKSLSVLEMKQEKKLEEKKEEESNLALSSKVVFRLEGENTIEEIQKLDLDIQQSRINMKEIKTNEIFSHKLLSILGTACIKEEEISKEIVFKVCRILFNLLTKVKLSSPNDIAKDITRDKKILYCLIKLAESETDGKVLAMELMVIGFILKNNFDNISIDFQTEEEITDICVEEVKNPHNLESFRNALTVFGILACQAILTLDNSNVFIKKVKEQAILTIIANSFSQENAKIVLECLEKLIHPNFQGKTQGDHQLNQAFNSMKEQVAKALLNTKFISKTSPLTLYPDKNTIESYAKILYQCLKVSKEFRDKFMEEKYWVDFASHKNLKIFCLAYDYLLNFQLLSDETIHSEYIQQPNDSRIITIFLIAKAYYKLSQKKSSKKKWEPAQTILVQISQQSIVDEDTKLKASREIEGFLCYGERLFDNILANTFCGIVGEFLLENNEMLDTDLCCSIFEKLLSLEKSTLGKGHKIAISEVLAAKLLILAESIPKFKKNEKFLLIFWHLLNYFITEKTIYRIHEKEDKNFNAKFLMSIFTFLKNVQILDEKHEKETELYRLVESADIHSLLLDTDVVNEKTLSTLLNFILKIVKIKNSKKQSDSRPLEFLGNKLISKLKPYLRTQEVDLLYEIIQSISSLIKNSQQYKAEIDKLGIIAYIPLYLDHPQEQIRHQTLTMIGNLSKHSDQFFDQYEKLKIFQSLKQSLEKYDLTRRVLKGTIYAIGNVSFYTERFFNDIKPLMPFLKEALNIVGDDCFTSNVFSTFSNLLRHSNIYLSTLEEYKIVEKVLEILQQTTTKGPKLDYGLNLIKKVVNYPEIYEKIPKERFKKIIENRKQVFPTNQNLRKLETMLK